MSQEKETTLKNIPHHIWSVIARSSCIDKDTNSLSLFHVVEKVSLSKDRLEEARKNSKDGAVAVPFGLEMVSLWERVDQDARTSEVKVEIADPDDKVVAENNYKLIFEEGKRQMRIKVSIGSVKITRGGVYRFRIKARTSRSNNYSSINDIPLEVSIK